MLDVRSAASKALALTIAVPYRAAGGDTPFAVFRPCMLHPQRPGPMAQAVIAAGFFEGIDSYQPAGLLDKYLDTTA
ncbi:hypothetical protein [Massilia sp. Se16.2.3]|uniref:hypothetical protein n=1 Tax=Massilia sp. Se16.2.3 TaxID=2709303 RepID=UPI0016033205|nr:hypothetical protein [Massilia sp. Se16.2.3]QNB01119.1 hypothetical protein G4G31_23720 [Massilia sp. Se16.2.3]